MARARATPCRFVVVALLACCVSAALGQESKTWLEPKTWLESLRQCLKDGRNLATPSNGGFAPSRLGTHWVGALVSLSPWVWGRGDPLYRYVGCRSDKVTDKGRDLGVANEAGACFHQCPGRRHVALKDTMCYCLDDGRYTDGAGCTKMCYRNPNNTCGGENVYSVYSLNLLNQTSKEIGMNWTMGHETAATFDSPSDDTWWIVPTPSSNSFRTYCHRSNECCDSACVEHQNLTSWPYKAFPCDKNGFEEMVLSLNSSRSLKIFRRQSRIIQGWIFLSRLSLGRWMDGVELGKFPPVTESQPGPLCGTHTWNGSIEVFDWKLCNASLPFLCSPAPPGSVSQSNAGGVDPTIVAVGVAGGVVVLAAVLITICICRKRARRQIGGSKGERQNAIEHGHVTPAADIAGDPDAGNYHVVGQAGASRTEYLNAQPGSASQQLELPEDEMEGNYACVDAPSKAQPGSASQQFELPEDEMEGNYACVDAPSNVSTLPVRKEAASTSSPCPASVADDAVSSMYAVVQKPTYRNAPGNQEAGQGIATPPSETPEARPSEDLYACVKK